MPDKSNPQTNGGRMVKRGDHFDPECWRTTHRLRVAAGILAGLGLKPTWEHSERQVADFGRMRHSCNDRCKAIWPEYATGAMFDLAYQLANEYQTEHGAYERGLAAAAKREQTKRVVTQFGIAEVPA